MNDLISVIIPIYNVENYLERCFESIDKQTYKNFEVILVCDKSSDNSTELCRKYAEKKDNVKFFFRENERGVSSARNFGIEQISPESKFTAFVDADDWLDPDYLLILHKNIVEYDADISFCKWKSHKKRGKDFKKIRPNIEIRDKHSTLSSIFYTYLGGTLWQKLFKTEIIKTLQFNTNLSYAEDLFFSYEYIQKIKFAVFTDQPLYHYTVRSNSASRNTKSLEAHYDLIMEFKDLIDNMPEDQIQTQIYAKSLCYLFCLELLAYCLLNRHKDKTMKTYLKKLANEYKPLFISTKKSFCFGHRLASFFGNLLI